MDTYKKILIENAPDIENYSFPVADECDAVIFDQYIQLDTIVNEIEQLNQMFLYNLRAFDPYILKYDDKVFLKDADVSVDFITINALFTNLISSGKVLMDRVDVILDKDFQGNHLETFRKQCSAKIYEHSFAYRFFSKLRNVCQHGHLLVSQRQDGRFCFDLNQIKELRHFCFDNKAIKGEIERIIAEIGQKYHDEPNICFTRNIDEYVKAVFEIYYKFLNYIRSDVEEICKNATDILRKRSEYVCKEKPYSGLVLYEDNEENPHLFMAKGNTSNVFLQNLRNC